MADDHLYLGTAQDNYDDMREKGRAVAFGHHVLPRTLELLIA